MALVLKWSPRVDSDIQNIYRSESYFSKDSLPSVFALAASDVREYVDETVIPSVVYYYRVGAVFGSDIKVSDIGALEAIEIIISEPADVVINNISVNLLLGPNEDQFLLGELSVNILEI